jgi:hypothetical protein
VAQVVEHLLCMHKALSSKPSSTKKKKEEEEKNKCWQGCGEKGTLYSDGGNVNH